LPIKFNLQRYSEVYHLVNDQFDEAFTGGLVGEAQQFILKVISADRIAMDTAGKLAVGLCTLNQVDP
jgi:hypothetical protein